MEDNVVRLPDNEERLLMEIDDRLGKADGYKNASIRNREAWCEEIIGVCAAVASLKQMHSALRDFGKRLDASGIKLKPHDRSACVAMGQDLERAREVFAKSTSWSIEMIYEHEFRFASDHKTINHPDGIGKPIRVTVPTQKAIDAIARIRARGGKVTQRTVGKEAGVSQTSVRRAFTMAKAVIAAGAPPPQKELDSYRKQLERENDAKIRAAVNEEVERLFDENFRHLYEKLDTLTKREKPFSRTEFKKLWRVCHPDNSAGEELRNEAFRILMEREAMLQPTEASELKQQSIQITLLHQEKLKAWRIANNIGKRPAPPHVMKMLHDEAVREIKR